MNDILVTFNSSSIVVLDLKSGSVVKTINLTQTLYALILAEKNYAIGLTSSYEKIVWDLNTSEQKCKFNTTGFGIDLVLIDDKYFANTLYPDNSIQIWNYLTCSLVHEFKFDSYMMSLVSIGDSMLASQTFGQIQIFDLNGFELMANFSTQNKYSYFPLVNFNDDFIFILQEGIVYLRNKENLSLNKTISFEGAWYGSEKLLAYKDFLVLNQRNDLLVLRISNGSLVKKLDAKSGGHRNFIKDAVLFQNSGLYATIGYDHWIKIWDLNKLVLRNTIDLSDIRQVYFIYKFVRIGSSYLLSYGNELRNSLWDVNNGDLVYNIDSYSY